MSFGLLVRRERWTLTLRGKAVGLLLLLGLGLAVRWEAYPFLAVSRANDGELMILEAWIPTHLFTAAAAEFKRGHYQNVLVLRSLYDPEDDVFFKDQYGRQSEDYTSRMIVKYGVPREAVRTVIFPAVKKDRTYHAALAARQWLSENHWSPKKFNVVTVGPHARRSWLMFAKVFGNTAEAGVVPLNDPMYDANHWWRTSEGVREMLGEAIAYIYARFFFAWTHETA